MTKLGKRKDEETGFRVVDEGWYMARMTDYTQPAPGRFPGKDNKPVMQTQAAFKLVGDGPFQGETVKAFLNFNNNSLDAKSVFHVYAAALGEEPDEEADFDDAIGEKFFLYIRHTIKDRKNQDGSLAFDANGMPTKITYANPVDYANPQQGIALTGVASSPPPRQGAPRTKTRRAPEPVVEDFEDEGPDDDE